MELEIDIEEPWPADQWEELAARAAAAAAEVAPEIANGASAISPPTSFPFP